MQAAAYAQESHGDNDIFTISRRIQARTQEHEIRKRKRMTNGSGSLEESEVVFKKNINNCWRGGWLRVPGHEAFRCEASAYLTSLYFLSFSVVRLGGWLS